MTIYYDTTKLSLNEILCQYNLMDFFTSTEAPLLMMFLFGGQVMFCLSVVSHLYCSRSCMA